MASQPLAVYKNTSATPDCWRKELAGLPAKMLAVCRPKGFVSALVVGLRPMLCLHSKHILPCTEEVAFRI